MQSVYATAAVAATASAASAAEPGTRDEHIHVNKVVLLFLFFFAFLLQRMYMHASVFSIAVSVCVCVLLWPLCWCCAHLPLVIVGREGGLWQMRVSVYLGSVYVRECVYVCVLAYCLCLLTNMQAHMHTRRLRHINSTHSARDGLLCSFFRVHRLHAQANGHCSRAREARTSYVFSLSRTEGSTGGEGEHKQLYMHMSTDGEAQAPSCPRGSDAVPGAVASRCPCGVVGRGGKKRGVHCTRCQATAHLTCPSVCRRAHSPT